MYTQSECYRIQTWATETFGKVPILGTGVRWDDQQAGQAIDAPQQHALQQNSGAVRIVIMIGMIALVRGAVQLGLAQPETSSMVRLSPLVSDRSNCVSPRGLSTRTVPDAEAPARKVCWWMSPAMEGDVTL